MIRSSTFVGRRIAVFGLGSSGNTAALSLMAGGADVAAWDDGEAGRASAAQAGIPLVDLRVADWRAFAALVLAPGVPLTHPMPHWSVIAARAAGIEIIGDVELFCRERAATCPDAPFIAITGTNGKSTTTALIAHILREAGRDVQMGGNIGVPILSLEPPSPDRIHVIEMSSFQIDLAPSVNPTVGVLLNITADHLDRHGTMEHYAEIKSRLLANADLQIVGLDAARLIAHPLAEPQAAGIPRRGTVIASGQTADVYAKDGQLWQSLSNAPVADLRNIGPLRGAHNGENAAAAFAALVPFLSYDAIAQHMATFPGLAHRMEQLGHIETQNGVAGRVLVVNDSKATNADSTKKALLSYPRDVFWIVGGKPKDGGIESLRPYFGGVVRAYLIGAASEEFARTLDGDVAIVPCGTIDIAVARASTDASAYLAASVATQSAAEPVILFSPACASFDQFQNFEKRGDAFRAIVTALPGFVSQRSALNSHPAPSASAPSASAPSASVPSASVPSASPAPADSPGEP